MKFLTLFGGALAFFLTFGASLHAGNEVSYALRDGAIGCFVGALMMRGLHKILVASIRSRVHARIEEVRLERKQHMAKLTTSLS
jgi:hypothetical protein